MVIKGKDTECSFPCNGVYFNLKRRTANDIQAVGQSHSTGEGAQVV